MTQQAGFAVASRLGIAIRSKSDISDALVACIEHGALILTESDLCPEFFDLRSGFAGEVLQKLVNCRARVAIVVEQNDAYGDRFEELIYEHSTHPQVRFFHSGGEAEAWLQGSGR